jgi:hypothetical protein
MDAGGFVPERIVVAKTPQALQGVAYLREKFQRDDAIDGAERSELAAIIKYVHPSRPPPPNLTPPLFPRTACTAHTALISQEKANVSSRV